MRRLDQIAGSKPVEKTSGSRPARLQRAFKIDPFAPIDRYGGKLGRATT